MLGFAAVLYIKVLVSFSLFFHCCDKFALILQLYDNQSAIKGQKRLKILRSNEHDFQEPYPVHSNALTLSLALKNSSLQTLRNNNLVYYWCHSEQVIYYVPFTSNCHFWKYIRMVLPGGSCPSQNKTKTVRRCIRFGWPFYNCAVTENVVYSK